MSLIQFAIAFVLNHPAVTAAIIGPRTMEQFDAQLGAVDVELDPGLLERIDQIVPPGDELHLADAGFTPPGARGTVASAPLNSRGRLSSRVGE